jgi:hypothetical protein
MYASAGEPGRGCSVATAGVRSRLQDSYHGETSDISDTIKEPSDMGVQETTISTTFPRVFDTINGSFAAWALRK